MELSEALTLCIEKNHLGLRFFFLTSGQVFNLIEFRLYNCGCKYFYLNLFSINEVKERSIWS